MSEMVGMTSSPSPNAYHAGQPQSALASRLAIFEVKGRTDLANRLTTKSRHRLDLPLSRRVRNRGPRQYLDAYAVALCCGEARDSLASEPLLDRPMRAISGWLVSCSARRASASRPA